MPFYEYSCDACGHELEELQKISDPALTDCPACDKPKLRKLVSAAAFKLTGTGWYETDFKDQSKPADGADKDSKSSGSDDSKKSDSKGESKDTKKAKKEPKKSKKETQTKKTKKDSK